MKLRFHRIRIPIFPKLMIIFLLTTSPLYGISLLMNHLGSATVESEISRSQLAQVEYYLHSLEIEMNRIIHLQLDYINDNSLQQLSVEAEILSEYEKTNAVNTLQRHLQIIKNSSPYVQNVSVYIPLIGHTVSTNFLYSSIPREEFEMIKAGSGLESPFIYWKGRLFLGFVYPDSFVNNDRTPNFILSVELSVPQLKEALFMFANHNQGGAVLIGRNWSLTGQSSTSVDLEQLEKWNADGKQGVGRMKWGNTAYLVTFEKSEALGASLFLYMPEHAVLGPLNTYRLLFWILSLLSIVIVSIFSYWSYWQIHNPLQKLLRAFRRAEEGDLDTAIQVWSWDEFNYIYDQFNLMVRKLKRSLLEVVEQSTRAQQSELKQLQAQINPHFLYNSFFILHGLAKLDDRESVIHLSKKLAQYFQFLTRNGSDEIELSTEVEHAKTYVDIQTIRFSSRIKVIFQEFPETLRSLRVPRLILQPIIENAYKYGLENRQSGGILKVSFEHGESSLVITVEDNGQDLSDYRLEWLQRSLQPTEEVKEFTGIINVHRRLQIKFGSGSGIEVSRGEEGGLRVQLMIQFPMGGGKVVQSVNR